MERNIVKEYKNCLIWSLRNFFFSIQNSKNAGVYILNKQK